MDEQTMNKDVLVLVAHADDETLGCGCYIATLAERGFSVRVVIASSARFSRGDQQVDNRPCALEACRLLGVQQVDFLELEDQRFEGYGTREIVDRLDSLELSPGLILTHSAEDLNRDHRVIHEIALLYARPMVKRIRLLGCEIPNGAQYYGKAFHPNYFVDASEKIELKKKAFACYTGEVRAFPHPYSLEGIEATARFRGMEVGLPFAEAFQVLRWFD
jgi:LmbE family N-acetylglucosaminyl deacetylase